MKRFLVAVGFLTIISVGKSQIREEDLVGSMVFFPLVGLMIGGFLVGVRFISLQVFSPAVVCALVIATWVVITGALHLDGFCDTMDGLSGGRNKEEILKIMEEPNIGAKGAVALVFFLLLKVFSAQEVSAFGLLIAPMIGRWATVVAGSIASYPKPSGLGKPFVGYIKTKGLFLSTLPVFVIGLILFALNIFWYLALILLFVFVAVSYLKKRIGGITGDNLGAICEIAETLSLLVKFG
ncbi:MAG: adenosylcobinamide-GDP ribazoletransferase [bacterium]|nr:adenosylcobinamide-GDP ribazoletransferase [bacterium]